MRPLQFRTYLEALESQTMANQAYQFGRSPAVQSQITNAAMQQMQPPSAPQNTSDRQMALDAIQATLDLVGLEPTIGTAADAANAIVSAIRAGVENDRRSEHLANAVISLVSMMPMADIAKLLKAQQMRGAAKGFVKVGQVLGRPVQAAARMLKQQRIMQAPSKLAG